MIVPASQGLYKGIRTMPTTSKEYKDFFLLVINDIFINVVRTH